MTTANLNLRLHAFSGPVGNQCPRLPSLTLVLLVHALAFYCLFWLGPKHAQIRQAAASALVTITLPESSDSAAAQRSRRSQRDDPRRDHDSSQPAISTPSLTHAFAGQTLPEVGELATASDASLLNNNERAETKLPMPVAAAKVAPPRFDADYLDNPAPTYPPLSRRSGEQGRVTLRVRVNPSGEPIELEIATSSGYPRLDAAALDAVRRWRFVPAKQGDITVAAWVLVPLNFSLKG